MGAGLQRAARATKYPGTPEPAEHQVWSDMTLPDREVTILSFGEKMRQVWNGEQNCYLDTPYRVAVCSVTMHGAKHSGTVSIYLDRFVPNKRGYKYLRMAERAGAAVRIRDGLSVILARDPKAAADIHGEQLFCGSLLLTPSDHAALKSFGWAEDEDSWAVGT